MWLDPFGCSHIERLLHACVLLYICGTWALSSPLADRIDHAQRKLLRKVMGLTWHHKLTNEDLYAMCGCLPARVQVINARLRLFGHVLRMYENAPALDMKLICILRGRILMAGKKSSVEFHDASVLSGDN